MINDTDAAFEISMLSAEILRQNYGQIDQFNFCWQLLEGGYTSIVVNGDYLTRNALIDFKVLRSDFTKENTLQILIYHLMGLCSVHEEFQQVKWLALFNPRKNLVKFVNVNQIAAPIGKYRNSFIRGGAYDRYESGVDISFNMEEDLDKIFA